MYRWRILRESRHEPAASPDACDDPAHGCTRRPYRLGLPAWAYPGWRGEYFEADPSPLASYASVFDTVEGNTTFRV